MICIRPTDLRIVLDLIPNHSSDEHDWFFKSVAREGKYADYYVWRNCTSDKMPNNWVSVIVS